MAKRIDIKTAWTIRYDLSPEDRRSIAKTLKDNNVKLQEVNKFACDTPNIKHWEEQTKLRYEMLTDTSDRNILESISKEAIDEVAVGALLKFDRDHGFDYYWCKGLDDPYASRYAD